LKTERASSYPASLGVITEPRNSADMTPPDAGIPACDSSSLGDGLQ
jgi:hypothetical protein